MVVFAGFPISIPYFWLVLNVPPLMNMFEAAFPLMNTPDPTLFVAPAGVISVPLPLALTLLSVTTLTVIPLPSLLVAVTFVNVTTGALKVAPSKLFVGPDFLFSVNDELLTVMDPPVVAEKPALFELFPS